MDTNDGFLKCKLYLTEIGKDVGDKLVVSSKTFFKIAKQQMAKIEVARARGKSVRSLKILNEKINFAIANKSDSLEKIWRWPWMQLPSLRRPAKRQVIKEDIRHEKKDERSNRYRACKLYRCECGFSSI